MKANLVLKSTSIFTSTTLEPISGFVAVADKKIVYVGCECGLKDYVDENTEVIDLGDKTITAGFIDAHIHSNALALQISGISTFVDGTSEEECIACMEEYAKTRKDGEWLMSLGWYLPLFTNPVMPTKASLDKVYPDRPVLMLSGDCHTAWVNSKALEILGYDENTPCPAGGEHFKDENGKLTGVFAEAAGLVVTSKICDLFDKSSLYQAYIDTCKYLNENGNTTVGSVSLMPLDGYSDGLGEDMAQELNRNGDLSCRWVVYPTVTKAMPRVHDLRDLNCDDMVRFGGGKQFFDGVSGTHTAFQAEPYANAYFEGDCGKLTVKAEDMREFVLQAQEAGISVRIHTIGDMSVHLALNFIEEAYEKYGRKDVQHCLEHVESILEGDIKRLAELNVLVSAQPAHSMIDMAGVETDLGLERTKLMWAFRMFLDNGVKLAFGTDAPISACVPLESMYYAVARKNLEKMPENGWEAHNAITLPEAIIAHTKGGAQALTMDDKIGTLEAGKYADIVVLDRNVFDMNIDELLETKCAMTFVNGKMVHKA